MKKTITEDEIDRHVAEQVKALTARGSTMPTATLRALSRTHLEMTVPPVQAPVHIPVPVAAPVAPPKPAPVPASPVKPLSAPVPPHDAAERVRVQRIIAMTPKGAEDKCGDAIRSGMPVVEFEGVLAARTILEAARFVRGA